MVWLGEDGKLSSQGSSGLPSAASVPPALKHSPGSHISPLLLLRAGEEQYQHEQRLYFAVTVQPAKGFLQSSHRRCGNGLGVSVRTDPSPAFVNSRCKLRRPFTAETQSLNQKYPGVEGKPGHLQAPSSSPA